MEIESQRRAVEGVHAAARLLHAVRGLESELQQVIAAGVREGVANGVPQAVLVEAAGVSKGWISRLLQEPTAFAADWRDILDALVEDPRPALAIWGRGFDGIVAEPPYPARRPNTGPVLPAINPLLKDGADPTSERVTRRLSDGMLPTLSLPHEEARKLIQGETREVLVPWATWYRGKVHVNARGAGSGERGQIIGTVALVDVSRSDSARPAEAYLWRLERPETIDRPRVTRRGAGGFFWN